MKCFILGKSHSGLPIQAYRFGSEQSPHVLVLGGVHGDEREGVEACLGLLERWQTGFPFQLKVTLVPMLNVDGVLRATRVNAQGVDLNRNMKTYDWSPSIATPRYHPGLKAGSESETQALADFIENEKPIFILSLHSWKPLLNTNGECEAEAAAIAEVTGYPVESTIGYPTPGCLGTYAGLERGIPTLTYEIERGLKTEEILRVHLNAVEAGLRVTEKRSVE